MAESKFAAWLERQMAAHGWGPTEMAGRLGISRQHFYRWIGGQVENVEKIQLMSAVNVAEALGVTVDEVARAMGLLEEAPAATQTRRELCERVNRLTEAEAAMLNRIAAGLLATRPGAVVQVRTPEEPPDASLRRIATALARDDEALAQQIHANLLAAHEAAQLIGETEPVGRGADGG